MKKIIKSVLLIGTALMSNHASAGSLFSDAVFGAGDGIITFNEVGVATGQTVTSQFGAQGATFSTNGPGSWYASRDPSDYAGNQGFSGRNLDSYSGGNTRATTYSILFNSNVNAAGAFWEFNTSSPAATFTALLNNVVLETFNYNNDNCCTSTAFIGFSGINFNEIQISNITRVDFIMDTVRFASNASVPEPASLALLGLGFAGMRLVRRKTALG